MYLDEVARQIAAEPGPDAVADEERTERLLRQRIRDTRR